MATPEQRPATIEDEQQAEEVLDPRHFYAAYIFDDAETRLSDVTTLLEQAQELGSPVRYWWLSEAMDLQDSADRLIVCVHHPAESEEAGMELYDALKDRQVAWDELEAAAVDEYRELGKSIKSPNSIYEPDGFSLFPESETATEALYILTREDLQTVAEEQLGRKLSVEEVKVVAEVLPEHVDWFNSIDAAIRACQETGTVRPAAESTATHDD